jgi:hypothetical protein
MMGMRLIVLNTTEFGQFYADVPMTEEDLKQPDFVERNIRPAMACVESMATGWAPEPA